MKTHTTAAPCEWYHCFNRGVDKRKVFESSTDYKRFLILLYVCNTKEAIHASDLREWPYQMIFTDTDLAKRRGDTLVNIGAYALMPNHFHILVQEKETGNLGLFMQKVMTGYTMYFNKKNTRTGPLFAGVFKKKHIDDDNYFSTVVSYIHLNPAEIADGQWKMGKAKSAKVKEFLMEYPYSSLKYCLSRFHLDKHITAKRQDVSVEASGIISDTVFDVIETQPKLDDMVREAGEYYAENFS